MNAEMHRAPKRAGLRLIAAAAVLLAGCAAGGGGASSPAGAPSSRPPTYAPPSTSATPPTSPPSSTAPTAADPVIREVPQSQWRRMVATGMWRRGCPVTRDQLRRLEVNHLDFDGEVQRGVLIVNEDVAPSLARIFTRLFDAGFPIRRMQPVEAYDGDSDASLRDDNTSAYNCRRLSQINAPPMKSPHAHGRAIDINPSENPWKDLRCRCWSPGPENHERRPGEGVILRGGVVWRAFKAEGWQWQDIDVPDYMHFDTGYPSKPFRERTAG